MKNLSHIISKVYGKPWIIQPSIHNSITTQLNNILSGKTALPDFETTINTNEEVIIHPKLAIIEVDGVIGKHLDMLETMCGGVDIDDIAAQLIAARDNEEIKVVVLMFNTPGGTVTGIPELAQLIDEVSQVKTVIGYTDTLCASAGMWLASQCTEFFASPSSEVGSIGVYCMYLDESQALALAGIKVNVISAGKYKITGASFQPLTEDERTMLQNDVDETYNEFKAAVTSKLKVKNEDMQGQVFSGVTSYNKGLVTGIINSKSDLLTLLVDKLNNNIN